jgi:hypothetical protein
MYFLDQIFPGIFSVETNEGSETFLVIHLWGPLHSCLAEFS